MVNGPLTRAAIEIAAQERISAAEAYGANAKVSDIPNLNGLVELARRKGVDIQPTLLRVMTDLYVQKPMHSAEEDRQFTELALRLIDVVDEPTRAVVTERIASHPGAPEAVRLRLLGDQIALSAPNAPHGPTAERTADRRSAACELSELFFSAGSQERRLILANLPYALIQPAPAIAPATGRDAARRLEVAALDQDSEAFAQELERTILIDRGLARRLTSDPGGEPIVVVATVLAMPADVFQRILLCLNAAISQSVQRVYELAELFEDVTPDMALRLLAIWQASWPSKQPSQRPASHRPQAHAVDTRSAPSARPIVRWVELARTRGAEGV
jgi:hypothetical protein